LVLADQMDRSLVSFKSFGHPPLAETVLTLVMLSDSRLCEEGFGRIADLGIIEDIVGSQLVTGCGTNVVAWLLVTLDRIEAHQVIAGGA
jgi:hypothetical protein